MPVELLAAPITEHGQELGAGPLHIGLGEAVQSATERPLQRKVLRALLRAAAMLVEPDDRSVVDVEELIVCWCDLWHNLDWRKLEWSLDAIPATNEPPPRRRVRKRAQRDAERQPLRIRLER